MSKWRNQTGKPLSSNEWLEAHHAAKIEERTKFVEAVLELKPNSILDLGCGPGLWLDLISKLAPHDCELYGIDIDESLRDLAVEKSKRWNQKSSFFNIDLNQANYNLPPADVYLAFNIFPYLNNPKLLIDSVIRNSGKLVVRQYDGNLLRFGPISEQERRRVDLSLSDSVLFSGQFKHYDLDRVYGEISKSGFEKKHIQFECFYRSSPFQYDFERYFANSIAWIEQLVNDESKSILNEWMKNHIQGKQPCYCCETELVAWLS